MTTRHPLTLVRTVCQRRLLRSVFVFLRSAMVAMSITSMAVAANFEFVAVESVFGILPRASDIRTHAIMIASGRRRFVSLPQEELAALAGDFYYQTKVNIDGKDYYRLAAGNYANSANAREELQRLQLTFPDAWIYKRGQSERESLRQFIANGPTDSAASGASLAVSKSAPTALAALGCMLEPSKKVEVSSPVAGVLDEVSVKRGDRVYAGDTLFRLKANVEKAGVRLAQAKTEFAKRKVERNVELYEEDLLSIHERDEIETELQLSEMELMLKQEELALRTVSSPISGVVVDRLRDKGEYVNVDPVIRLATLDPLHIDLLLPAEYFGKVVVSQKLMITARPTLARSREATVTTVDPLIDPASGTFRVQLEMSNPGDKIPAGLRCVARVGK